MRTVHLTTENNMDEGNFKGQGRRARPEEISVSDCVWKLSVWTVVMDVIKLVRNWEFCGLERSCECECDSVFYSDCFWLSSLMPCFPFKGCRDPKTRYGKMKSEIADRGTEYCTWWWSGSQVHSPFHPMKFSAPHPQVLASQMKIPSRVVRWGG